MFEGMGDVTGVLDLREVLPGIGPAARLDEKGGLFLDRAVCARVGEAFAGRLDPTYLRQVERTRRVRVEALSAATSEAHRVAPAAGGGRARASLVELARLVSDVLPYPILAKFIPDLLLEALAPAGDLSHPPAALPSPGVRLSRALVMLYLECLDRGYGVQRLEAEWPGVDDDVASAVASFVSAHAGFGPVAWEAPGYETPAFVFDSMKAAFSGLDRERLRSRAATSAGGLPPETGEGSWEAELRSSLRSWAGFMEHEVLLVREAFYMGFLPLLGRIAVDEDLAADDLLFVEVHELAGRLPDGGEIARRKERYLSDHAYLSRHGIDSGRLRALFEATL